MKQRLFMAFRELPDSWPRYGIGCDIREEEKCLLVGAY